MRTLSINTVSKNLRDLVETQPIKVRLFNFSDGITNINLKENDKKTKIGSFDTTWVRVYDEDDDYYDFISSSIFFTTNMSGVLIMCAEDTEYINADYISKLIVDYVDKQGVKTLTSEKYINQYYNTISKEIKQASRRLQELYSASSQTAVSRLDIEDSFEYGRAKLTRKYLIDLVSRKIIRENKDSIMELLG